MPFKSIWVGIVNFLTAFTLRTLQAFKVGFVIRIDILNRSIIDLDNSDKCSITFIEPYFRLATYGSEVIHLTTVGAFLNLGWTSS